MSLTIHSLSAEIERLEALIAHLKSARTLYGAQPADEPAAPSAQRRPRGALAAQILAFLRAHPGAQHPQVVAAVLKAYPQMTRNQVAAAISRLKHRGRLSAQGSRRRYRYRIVSRPRA